jgi:hypothetical protein
MREGAGEALISLIWVIGAILPALYAQGGRGGAN